MKNLLFHCAFAFILIFWVKPVLSQTIIATETFGTAAAKGTPANGFVGDMGAWTSLVSGPNGASANEWYVSGEECGNAAGVCGSACPGGDNSLHVSAIGGLCGTPDCGAAYDETGVANLTNKRAISPTIDCSGAAGIQLGFNYIAAQGDDGFIVEYSLDNGATWTTFTGGNLAESGCCCLLAGFCTNPADPTPCADLFSAQGFWTVVNLNFPIGADNNSTVKFAFHWSNDGNGVGTDPSVAIDDIVVQGATILELSLTEFTAQADENINELYWSTNSEFNVDKFEVLVSSDGISFSNVTNIQSQGNSNSKQHYSFYHEVRSEQNYYQLKITDLDGKTKYSEVIYVHNKLDGIHLKTTNNEFAISGLSKFKGSIRVFDLSGMQVKPTIIFNRPESDEKINLSELKNGIYFINVNSELGQKTFKIYLNQNTLK